MPLKQLFTNTILKFTDNQTIKDILWQQIEANYSEKSRFYHTLTHLNEMFDLLDQVKSQITDYDTVFFAVFYHDIIYNPQAKDNEEQSADLMKNSLSKINFPSEKINNCYDQIIATKSHSPTLSKDTNFLLDADLAILGQTSEKYQNYTQQIRKEYSFYSNEEYKKGRIKVLNHFLKNESIYKTIFFKEKFEKQARLNIQNELNTIEKLILY
ncbi:MAG: hypothetical protein JXL97_14470 [Bacteroidales bacterium]|nr:hypothetical protein [Bacteroidales bacterium]